MRIAVLGASGRVGRLLVDQASERGHQVVALVRTPDRFTAPVTAAVPAAAVPATAAVPAAGAPSGSRPGRVEVRQADVSSPASFPALGDVDVVVSAIGISKGDGPGALVAGARVLAASGVRTVWLGALGSGASTGAGGAIYQAVMRLFVGKELAEKAAADQIALAAGATVVHAPDLGNGPLGPERRILRLAAYQRPLMPRRISRATLAALMLDEAESGEYGAEIVVPAGGSK
jgi:hypothetical protein